jgi:hypothetical protein
MLKAKNTRVSTDVLNTVQNAAQLLMQQKYPEASELIAGRKRNGT